MGIERFFSSIQQNSITNLHTSFTKTLEQRLVAEYLYIDYNSIVHITSAKIMQDLNYLLFKIIQNKPDDKNVRRIISDYSIDSKISVQDIVDIDLDNLIITKVVEYTVNILTNYIDPKKLKLFYIAIDGVPLKSKMIEQRKRRYMGSVIDKMKGLIFEKHDKELSEDPTRYMYETKKLKWSKTNITPGTEFMDNLVNSLVSDEFKKRIHTLCPALTDYIFSGPYEPGEGEKKIVDHLRGSDHKKSDYLIYSPDSDVSLLCLLLNTSLVPGGNKRITKINILRHNMQQDNYDVVDIDALSENLYQYTVKQLLGKGVPDKDSVINDIVFMLTIFGDDFVPKLQSYNIKYDFTRVIDKWISVLMQEMTDKKFNYLVAFGKNETKSINFKVFFQIIGNLKEDEGGNLQKMYMSSHYRNYDHLKRTMDADHMNFTKVMNDFLSKIRKFNYDIRGLNKKSSSDGIKKIKEKWLTEDNHTFISKLIRLTKLGIENQHKLNNDEFIDYYVDHYLRQNKLPQIGVYFQKYVKSLNIDFYKQKLEKSLDRLDQGLKVTGYDEEIFKFDNMLDEYQTKLRATPIKLGYVGLDQHTYTWKSEKISDSVKKYYKEFFDIDNIDSGNNKMQKLVQDYIDGLVWVFDFYFNNFDESVNRMHGDSWFYLYEQAPLLTQIYHHLSNIRDTDYLENVSKRLRGFRVPRADYFNCLEHFMYVSPAPYLLDIVPSEYLDFVNNTSFYPDLDKAVNKIYNEPMATDEIDCRGQMFLNKCNLKAVHIDRDFDNTDKRFIGELRKIKVGPMVENRKGTYKVKSSNINYIVFGTIDKLTGSSVTNKDKYNELKAMYLESGDTEDKKTYKRYKYKLFGL
jgi:5'-3' exonuclease